ncbi:serine protease [Aquibium sp. ELW1220]|uniref:trypsin-like serine peptidase n=1 Tax=Aquibium sp. ELW1220 TaxID=2976766 RepID=UPI0025B138BF|nr:serine protease [Aquibium sp. ELW1220]MDN2584290.1 serine protease [Aquibium sp. ELW1220]
MRRLGREVSDEEVVAPSATDVQAVAANSFEPKGLEVFSRQAAAYRCRIWVNNQVAGSGVLVSYRLVLTAWHVVNRKTPWDAAQPPRIEILTSDRRRLAARLAGPFSDCHPDEWDDGDIPDADLAGHHDFVLLRLFEPVGYSLGYLDIPAAAAVWAGVIACVLIHYPDGADQGLTFGQIAYGGPSARYEHVVPTRPGSSGGATFSNALEFIGLHQGVIGNRRRLVPAAPYANDDAFRACLRADGRPTYLWSLTRSLNAHLIIGRRTFFDGLDAIVGDSRMVRGIWVRRVDPRREEAGLSFSFRMLENFLALRAPEARAVRIDIPTDGSDLFDLIAGVLDDAEPGPARPGVRRDETTFVAHERDRADLLVGALDRRAAPLWLHLEGPSQEPGREMQLQLEQLVSRLASARNIRTVLTRLEKCHMPVPAYQSLADAAQRARPGLLLDYVGGFSRDDVRDLVRVIDSDLGLDLNDGTVEDFVDKALDEAEEELGRYGSAQLAEVSERLKSILLPWVPT